MNRKSLVYLCCFIALAVILTGSFAFAQGQGPGPGQGQGMGPGPGGPNGQGMRFPQMPPAPVIKAGNEGVYILSGLKLYKYNPTTLKLVDSIQLLDPPPAPANDAGGQMMFARMMPASMMIAQEAGLVIVISGDQFISVDGKTMRQKAKGTLPSIQPAVNQNNAPAPGGQGGGAAGGPPFGMMGFSFGPPVMELHGNTLYMTRMDQLFAIDITTGKVAAAAALPKPDAPQ